MQSCMYRLVCFEMVGSGLEGLVMRAESCVHLPHAGSELASDPRHAACAAEAVVRWWVRG
jgi:hypothetical protein